MKNCPQSGRITNVLKKLSTKWTDNQNGEITSPQSGRIPKVMKNCPQSGRITNVMKKLSTKWTDHQNGEQNYKSKSGRITKTVQS